MDAHVSHRHSAWSLLAVVTIVSFLTGCPNTMPLPGQLPGDGDSLFPGLIENSVAESIREFTIPPAGGGIDLPGIASLSFPQGAAGDIHGAMTQTMLTDEGRSLFADLNDGAFLIEPLTRIAVEVVNDQPSYVVLRMPATGPNDRIYVAGYIDEDTGGPAWVPVRGTFDEQTGMLTAMIGIGLLGPDGTAAARIKTSAAQGGSMVYSGYAGVGVGGREFRVQVVFIADEPAPGTTVNAGDAPIAVRGRIGIQFSNITNPPLDSLTVTSDFGPRNSPAQGASTNHMGVDYRAADGTNVHSVGDGTVIRASCQTNSVNCGRTATGNITGGYIVEIDHGNGEVSRYMHMTNPASVNVGDTVTAGQSIGRSDSTGGVAPHLHFEIKQNGVNVDPEDILNSDGATTATLALALDFEMQEGSRQAIPVQLGNILAFENLASYVDILELDNVIAGNRKLQFVLIEPNGTFEILAEVPITIRPRLTALTPDNGYFEDMIVATGKGFDFRNPANNVVDFSDINHGGPGTAEATAASGDSLEFSVPVGAVFGPVKVVVNGVESTDTVEFSPYVKGLIWNPSDETDEPVTMQVTISPNDGCNPLSMGATSFSLAPGGNHELTLRAGDSFTATATWPDPDDPMNINTSTHEFFCDGDDTGTITQYRGVDTNFYVHF